MKDVSQVLELCSVLPMVLYETFSAEYIVVLLGHLASISSIVSALSVYVLCVTECVRFAEYGDTNSAKLESRPVKGMKI